MSRPSVALVADPTSPEACSDRLAEAVHLLTGAPPVRIDSRHFADGGTGRTVPDGDRLRLRVPGHGVDVRPDIVVLYEIPPHKRRSLAGFQRALTRHGVVTLAGDPESWRAATEKNLTVERLARDGVAQMETVVLRAPDEEEALAAFDKLGRDTWARPVVGTGGNDAFHLTTPEAVRRAAAFYAERGTDWLLSRDARNLTPEGHRHQFRVFVLDGQVVHAREHIQPAVDTPCNTCQGATPVPLGPRELPGRLGDLAVAATASMGLPFAGVDLAAEHGGVVFEVNVQPAFVEGEVTAVAVPYIQAHLDRLAAAERTPCPGPGPLRAAPA